MMREKEERRKREKEERRESFSLKLNLKMNVKMNVLTNEARASLNRQKRELYDLVLGVYGIRAMWEGSWVQPTI